MNAPSNDPKKRVDQELAGPESPLAAEPFVPPGDYAFEPELLGPAPRAIPPQLYQGRFAQRRRQTAWGLAAAGVFCILAGQLPIVARWGVYFLPFAYFTWIGAGCVVIAGLSLVAAMLRKGPYQYVEEGVPIVVRVSALAIRTSKVVHGQEAAFHFVAIVDCPDPATGRVETAEIRSREISTRLRKRLTTSFRVGDYVTAVYLPSDPSKTLSLYGFLELRPGLGIINREEFTPAGPLKVCLTILAVFAFFFVLCWNLYAFGRYYPREHAAAEIAVGVVGGVLLGGLWLAAMAYGTARNRQHRENRNQLARVRGEAVELTVGGKRGWFGNHGIVLGLVNVCGAVLLSGVTLLCWCYTANALLDRSPAQRQVVLIDEMIQQTHGLIFRQYYIGYRFVAGNQGKQRFLSTPAEMARFQNDIAAAEIHAGWLGWPWVKSIVPVIMRHADPDKPN